MSISATYDKTIFETAKDGVLVGLYKVKDGKCETFTGQNLPKDKGVFYAFEGEWVEHKRYGRQFKVETYAEDLSSGESIIKYLSSSLIKGVGPVIAKRIVDKFGEKTIEVMDTDIDEIKRARIKGLSSNKFEEFKKSYMEQSQSRKIILELSKYGISSTLSLKAYKKFGLETMSIIKKEPFKLCEIEGISFVTADRLGKNLPGYENNDSRFLYCANYVMYGNENNIFKDITGCETSGSNCMEIQAFGKVMYKLLRINNLTQKDVCDKTINLIKEKRIKLLRDNGNQYVMPMGLYGIEERTAELLSVHSKNKCKYSKKVLERTLNESSIKLSEEQKNAVRNAYENGVSIIIGVPGSGKTTTINTIARSFKEQFPDKEMYFLAPSGRAAAHIKETMAPELASEAIISTIHSAIGIDTDSVNNLKEEEIKIENSLVFIDEFSMVDTRLAYQLFSALSNCTIVICGDDEQLPSVGSGAVLRDLIATKVVPITTLTHVFRQAEESDIYANLYKIRDGISDLSEGHDFHFIEENKPENIENIMLDLYFEKIKEFGIENVMLISPMKDYDMGTRNLNVRIQEKYNPADGSPVMRCGYEFRTGDIVMQLKNNYDENVMNGDLGEVTGVFFEENEKVMTVRYPHKTVKYTKDNINELQLGYAYTIHKAQGSEAKCVITCVHEHHSRMLMRNLYYTGITRAKDEIYIVGQRNALKKAIANKTINDRLTSFQNQLNRYFGEFYY